MIKSKHHAAIVFLAASLVLVETTTVCRAQTAPNLPPGVQDVVKLVKAGLGEDVVLAHIKNAGAFYSLSADQLIYLHEQGVSQPEIKALLGSSGSGADSGAAPAPVVSSPDPAPAASSPPPSAAPPPPGGPGPGMPPNTAPPGAPTSIDSFRPQLSAYGTWMDMPGYGMCWRPSVAADSEWRPYCQEGHWVYTTDGWSWQSDYPWGDTVFHYGRWHRGGFGWVWVPGYDWAPAWVTWRHVDGYCGWAPLPPEAVFRPGVGLWYRGRLAVDVDFGLDADRFTFVAYDHFWDHHLHGWLLPRERVRFVFGRSVVMNGYRVEHGRLFVEGIGHERVARFTHHEIRVEESHFHRDFREHEAVERRVIHDDHRDRRDDHREDHNDRPH